MQIYKNLLLHIKRDELNMWLTEEQKEMVKKFVGDNISSNKKIDYHLEKMYRKKEKTLTKKIKNKTRDFREILLKNGFKEANLYKN